ncbi:type I-B CRISPR-associated protein Cas7/Cst2/DevR [Fusibacter paucivorans]|uniref:Type I-B CRISPR-associated protein Cas7/Cst2/DevR n=2 Tax=Fusibacter paucivorans TaxID=76009 RepID=A0ABS5PKS2_9FIRM|nr:type I-B CRISPR-associated protein Cas7/Cst2/DevR [Fusibacter paucivorans]
MMKKGLTISMIFNANSANYSEGFGNISTLKKLHRGDGNTYTYISRQAIRYSLTETLGWQDTPVSVEKTVAQFSPDATIDQYPEIDFFGYMKTKAKEGADTRSAVCRLSHAIALEPYKSDLDFLTNMGLSKRVGGGQMIAQSEIHESLYAYTLTLDLDLVGIDGDITIDNIEKARRVKTLLNGIKLLHRDIKGRRENLSPLFIIGGVYDMKSPHFEGRLKVKNGKLETAMITQVLALDEVIAENTEIGYIGGVFNNDSDIEALTPIGIGAFFKALDQKVDDFYETN